MHMFGQWQDVARNALNVAQYIITEVGRRKKMADDADRANDYVDLTLAHCLSRAPKFDKPSLTECLECGEDIPARRQAVGGVTLCVDCQSVFERRGG